MKFHAAPVFDFLNPLKLRSLFAFHCTNVRDHQYIIMLVCDILRTWCSVLIEFRRYTIHIIRVIGMHLSHFLLRKLYTTFVWNFASWQNLFSITHPLCIQHFVLNRFSVSMGEVEWMNCDAMMSWIIFNLRIDKIANQINHLRQGTEISDKYLENSHCVNVPENRKYWLWL